MVFWKRIVQRNTPYFDLRIWADCVLPNLGFEIFFCSFPPKVLIDETAQICLFRQTCELALSRGLSYQGILKGEVSLYRRPPV